MIVVQSAVRGTPVDLQPAGTSATGNGNVIAVPDNFSRHAFSIITSAGVASGAVTFESADSPDYAGTWNPIVAAVTVPAASAILTTQVPNGLFRFVRGRISTVIGSGTVQVQYTGAPV